MLCLQFTILVYIFFTISFLNFSLFRASFAVMIIVWISGNVFWYIPVLKFLILRSLMGKKVHFVHKTHENFFYDTVRSILLTSC